MLANAQSRLRRIGRDESGFTLVELLIVIVMLSVLAAIVAFSLRGITGEVAAGKAEVETVAAAIEA